MIGMVYDSGYSSLISNMQAEVEQLNPLCSLTAARQVTGGRVTSSETFLSLIVTYSLQGCALASILSRPTLVLS